MRFPAKRRKRLSAARGLEHTHHGFNQPRLTDSETPENER